ncbi:MAG: helix-turn-helix domain-containing protein [Candidatus Latescibacterota bacterium]|jgi:excisionase family DNA binding protein
MRNSSQLPNKRLLRVDEVAEALSCSRRTVYYMIESGKLDAQRAGPRLTRISRDSVERLASGADPQDLMD